MKKTLLYIFLIFSFFFLYISKWYAFWVDKFYNDIDESYIHYYELQTLFDRWKFFPKSSDWELKPYNFIKRDDFVWTVIEVSCKRCIQPNTPKRLSDKYYKKSPFFDIWVDNSNYYCVSVAKEDRVVMWYNPWDICEDKTSKVWERPFCINNYISLEEALAILLRYSSIYSAQEWKKIDEDIKSWKISENLAEDLSPKLANWWVYTFYKYFKKALEYELVDYDSNWLERKYKLVELDANKKLNPKKKITKHEFIKMAYIIFKTNSCPPRDDFSYNQDIWLKIESYDADLCSENKKCDILSDFDNKDNTYDFKWIPYSNNRINVPDWYAWEFYNTSTWFRESKYWKYIDDYKFNQDWDWIVYLRVSDIKWNSSKAEIRLVIDNNKNDDIEKTWLSVMAKANPIFWLSPLLVDFEAIIEENNLWNNNKKYNYFWDFWDGYSSDTKITNHIYKSPWNYEVVLELSDDDWNYSKSVLVVKVEDNNSCNEYCECESWFICTDQNTDTCSSKGICKIQENNLALDILILDKSCNKNIENCVLSDLKSNSENVFDFKSFVSSDNYSINEPNWYLWEFKNLDNGDFDIVYGPYLDNYELKSEWKWIIFHKVVDKNWNTAEVENSLIYIENKDEFWLSLSIEASKLKWSRPFNVDFDSIVSWAKWNLVYFWDFWNNKTSTKSSDSSVYLKSWEYEVKLKVKDEENNEAFASLIVNVEDSNNSCWESCSCFDWFICNISDLNTCSKDWVCIEKKSNLSLKMDILDSNCFYPWIWCELADLSDTSIDKYDFNASVWWTYNLDEIWSYTWEFFKIWSGLILEDKIHNKYLENYTFKSSWDWRVVLSVVSLDWNFSQVENTIFIDYDNFINKNMTLDIWWWPLTWLWELETKFEALVWWNYDGELIYTWDMWDGTIIKWKWEDYKELEYRYTKLWIYEIKLEVEDEKWLKVNSTQIVEVKKDDKDDDINDEVDWDNWLNISLKTDKLEWEWPLLVKLESIVWWAKGEIIYNWYINWLKISKTTKDILELFNKPWEYKLKLIVKDSLSNTWEASVVLKVLDKKLCDSSCSCDKWSFCTSIDLWECSIDWRCKEINYKIPLEIEILDKTCNEEFIDCEKSRLEVWEKVFDFRWLIKNSEISSYIDEENWYLWEFENQETKEKIFRKWKYIDNFNFLYNWEWQVKLRVIDKFDNTSEVINTLYIWDNNDFEWLNVSISADKLSWQWPLNINFLSIVWWSKLDLEYKWYFSNDQSTYYLKDVSKLFVEPWVYEVALNVSDSNWRSWNASLLVKILAPKPCSSSCSCDKWSICTSFDENTCSMKWFCKAMDLSLWVDIEVFDYESCDKDLSDCKISDLNTDTKTYDFNANVEWNKSDLSYKWLFENTNTWKTDIFYSKFIDDYSFLTNWEWIVKLEVVDQDWNYSESSMSIYYKKEDNISDFSLDIKANPIFWSLPLRVDFESFLSDNNTSDYTYKWDFWDWSNSDQKNPTYTYNKPWTYKVVLEVKNWLNIVKSSLSIKVQWVSDMKWCSTNKSCSWWEICDIYWRCIKDDKECSKDNECKNWKCIHWYCSDIITWKKCDFMKDCLKGQICDSDSRCVSLWNTCSKNADCDSNNCYNWVCVIWKDLTCLDDNDCENWKCENWVCIWETYESIECSLHKDCWSGKICNVDWKCETWFTQCSFLSPCLDWNCIDWTCIILDPKPEECNSIFECKFWSVCSIDNECLKKDLECNYNSDCTDWNCDNWTCVLKTIKDCDSNKDCNRWSICSIEWECIQTEESCIIDSNCESPDICLNGSCIKTINKSPICDDYLDCEPWKVCDISWKCIWECTDWNCDICKKSQDCTQWYECKNWSCIKFDSLVSCNSDCLCDDDMKVCNNLDKNTCSIYGECIDKKWQLWSDIIIFSKNCDKSSYKTCENLDKINEKENIYDFYAKAWWWWELVDPDSYFWEFYNSSTWESKSFNWMYLDDFEFSDDWLWYIKLDVVDKDWNSSSSESQIVINNIDWNIKWDKSFSVDIIASPVYWNWPLKVDFSSIIWWNYVWDLSYTWDFWDWFSDISAEITHVYFAKKSFDVSLKVSDSSWNTWFSKVVIKVIDSNSCNENCSCPSGYVCSDDDNMTCSITWTCLLDSDFDWVADEVDECIFIPWKESNAWCPIDCDENCDCPEWWVCTSYDLSVCSIEWQCIFDNKCSASCDCPEWNICTSNEPSVCSVVWECKPKCDASCGCEEGSVCSTLNAAICSINWFCDKDTDGDWISDTNDECIFEEWTVENNWCPEPCDETCSCSGNWKVCDKKDPWVCSILGKCVNDSDDDWVADSEDKCQNIPWSEKNDWCPILELSCNSDCSCPESYKCSSEIEDQCSVVWVCVPENRCDSSCKCDTWYTCSTQDKNICSIEWICIADDSCLETDNGSSIFWNVVCDTCPCENYLDFKSSVRKCDIIFPAIVSPDGRNIYSKWDFFEIWKKDE